MSAAVERPVGEWARPRPKETRRYRAFAALVVGANSLALLAAFQTTSHEAPAFDIALWMVLISVASLLPIYSGKGAWLALDLPLLLGAGFVFGPALAGIVGLLGAFDRRELRREISFARAAFNRAQVSLSAMAGATAFMLAGGHVGSWPLAALAGLLGLFADCIVNYSLVAASTAITSSRSFREVLAEMHLGPARSFVPAYLCFGFLASLIAEAYVTLGMTGVLASIAPVLLARQAFQSRHDLDDANQRLRIGEAALSDVDRRVAHERRDERLALAGELHDEVLPPLFKVHLMGQVLRQDLSAGRLLDLDDDLPQLLEATEAAQSAIRDLLSDLRRSPLGSRGLLPTLRLLVEQLETSGSPRIDVSAANVEGSEQSQLLIYQIAREALANATKYSEASKIALRLWSEGDQLRLVIEDDGTGFVQESIDRTRHFGLQFMSERATACGGDLAVESVPGVGTLIVARIPSDL